MLLVKFNLVKLIMNNLVTVNRFILVILLIFIHSGISAQNNQKSKNTPTNSTEPVFVPISTDNYTDSNYLVNFKKYEDEQLKLLKPTVFAQNTDVEKLENKEFSKNKSEQISNKLTSDSLTDSTNLFINRIDNIEAHIKAIDTKVEYISSDQSKKAKAEENGWFTQMQNIKEQLILERILLLSKLSSNIIKE